MKRLTVRSSFGFSREREFTMAGIYALTIIIFIYALGEVVSKLTKARIPAGLAWAVLLLGGLWTNILKPEIFSAAQVSGFGMLVVALMITMLGSTIDTPELKRQVKVIIICLATVVVSSAAILLIDPLIVNKQYAYVGAPVYAGGGAVALLLTSALKEREGMTAVVGFFTILGTAQGLFGLPVCSFFLRKFAKNFLADKENVKIWAAVSEEKDEAAGGLFKKKFMKLPKAMDTVPMNLLKVALISSLATFLAGLTGGVIHAFVISLIFGWFFTETGFLSKNMMAKIESAGLVTFLASTCLFGNYVGVTPQMFLSYLIPIVVVMVTGIVFTALTGFVLAKLLKMEVGLAIALGLTCTFGFPMTMILTNNVVDAMAVNEEEHKALYNILMPKMLVAGFVTVTIVSVFVGSFVLSVFF